MKSDTTHTDGNNPDSHLLSEAIPSPAQTVLLDEAEIPESLTTDSWDLCAERPLHRVAQATILQKSMIPQSDSAVASLTLTSPRKAVTYKGKCSRRVAAARQCM